MADPETPKIMLNAADIPGLELTPVFCNRVNVTLGAITTRIALGEFVVGNQETDTNFHTAIVLPTTDALALAKLILTLFDQNQQAKRFQEVMQEAIHASQQGT